MISTPLDLEAIKARAEQAAALAEKATPGPWEQYGILVVHYGPGGREICSMVGPATYPEFDVWLIDAAFIAAARTTVPQLAADVRALLVALEAERAETARLRAERDELVSTVNQYEMHAMGFKLTKAQE